MTATLINMADWLRRKTTQEPKMDAQFINHGSIWLCRPLTTAGRAWIEDHISADAPWFGVTLAIEARYVGDIAKGMAEDGLAVG
jgi:hypothetical protein